jgi:glycerophosphoryl diester phosphodiesterase
VRSVSKADTAEHRIPTFDEALAVCRGKMKVYVDHKSGPPADVFAAIKRHEMVSNVVIYGGVESLRAFKKLEPSVWIMPDHPGSAEQIRKLVADLKPETLDGNLRDWTQEQVAAAHKAGAQVWVDNLGPNDNEAGFEKAVQFGVDAIQTDHPAALVQFLKKTGRKE